MKNFSITRVGGWLIILGFINFIALGIQADTYKQAYEQALIDLTSQACLGVQT